MVIESVLRRAGWVRLCGLWVVGLRGPWLVGLFFLLGVCGSEDLSAQVVCTSVYIKEYIGTGNGPMQAHAVKSLPDGTLLVVGRAALNGAPSYDGFISKHAADGSPLWTFFIGGPGNDDLSGITPLNDGSFILFGTTESFGHAEGKGWLVHIDANGAVIWSGQLGAAATSADRIKAVQPYTDGDLIGTLNTSDSSAASDPVVFKLGLDGTVRWTHRFDNGNDDSFTTLAIGGNTVYAGGYTSSGGAKLAVLTQLDAATGNHLQTSNINNGDASFNEEITGLEIGNNQITYGLYVTKGISYNGTNGIVLIQTDLAGNNSSAFYAQDAQMEVSYLKTKRAPDGGRFVLRTNTANFGLPTITKIDSYGYLYWGLYLNGNLNTADFADMDVMPDGGTVSAGDYFVFNGRFTERLNLTRTTVKGEIGSCNLSGENMYLSPGTYNQVAFTWAAEPAFVALSTTVTTVSAPDPLTTATNACTDNVCVDHTPIPAGCGKTYNIQYQSTRASVLRDVLATPDGGRVAVGGTMTQAGNNGLSVYNGLVMKYQSNGAIAWSKTYGIPGHSWLLRRILRTADGNLLVVGVDYYISGYYGYAAMVLLKLDNNGNLIWEKEYSDDYTEPADVAATPDNGFVVTLYDNWGGGSDQYGYVARFDANANFVWRSQVIQPAFTPVLRAIACTNDAVFVASDAYIYNTDQFEVDRLDLATGKMIYSTRHTAGAGTSVAVNSLFATKDTVYAFLYHYVSGATAPVTNLMVGIDQQGKEFRALNLGADNINPNPTWPYSNLDGNPPSVTMTPDQDFWLASRITLGGTDYMTVTRMKTDGTVELSKLHSAINNYQVFNVRPQGQGVILVGYAPALHSGAPQFGNAFVLKLDNTGQLQAGAAANCVATDRPFVVTTCSACANVTPAQPPASTTPQTGQMTSVSPFVENNDISAVLYCFQPGNCNIVNLQQRGQVCALHDTLVYYLDHSGNCAAAATWNFDPSFFQPGVISGDSIELITQKAGSSPVGVQIEGYCSFTQQTVTANISFSDGPFDLGPDTVVCANGPTILQANPGYSNYVWSDNSTGTTLSAAPPGSSLPVSAAGVYAVSAIDQCGHSHQASVTVTDANALFHLTPDTIRCNSDIDTLRASPGYTNYQWSPGYNLQAQDNLALVTPDQTKSYTVTAWRSAACMVSKSVLVTAQTSPAIRLGGDTSLCIGDSLVLDAGGGFNGYLWSSGATTQRLTVRQPGEYRVRANYANGCISRDSLRLVSLYNPRPGFGPDTTLCIGKDLLLDAGAGDSLYRWSDGSGGSTLRLTSPGSYWVQVTDPHGCVAGDTVTVVQQSCAVGVFVPNAFTPGAMGHNGLFRPIVFGNIRLIDFSVYGRWGEKLFETRTLKDGWDGMINGVAAPAGTYVWVCRYQPDHGPVQEEKGTVVLIR